MSAATATTPAQAPTDRGSVLEVYRDDGPLATAIGRALGRGLPLPAIALLLVAGLPLLVAIALEGDGASHGLVAGVIAWAVLLGGLASGRPLDRPPALDGAARAARDRVRAGCCGSAPSPGDDALPATFALLCAITYHHYETVYGPAPPRRQRRRAGCDARRRRLGRAARARRRAARRPARCRPAFCVLAGLLAVLFVGETSPSGGASTPASSRSMTTRRMRPTDRHGARGRGRAAARVADGRPSQDAAAGRRRPHDPRHRARQPAPRRDGDGRGRHRLRGRAHRGAPAGARGAPRASKVETVFNPKAEEWNNCYSLWCAREHFARGVLLCNGDTVHPPEVEERLLAGRGHSELVLALDDAKTLGEEEMKVLLDGDGLLRGINKAHDPAEAAGEYIGLTLIEPAGADGLAEALEATWQRDPSLYYEDGFQEYADRGGRVGVASVGGLEWVEVDDQATWTRRGRWRGAAEPDGRGAPDHRHRRRRRRRARSAARRPPHLQRRPRRGSRSGPGRARRSPRCCARSSRTPTSGWSRAARSRPPPSCAGACAPASSTRSSGSAAARRSTPPSTPPRCPGCRWSRSRRRSPTTGSPRRSPRWRTAGARRASACRCRSPSSSTSTTCARATSPMRRSGIGDVVSNLGAIADWWLASRERGEPVDGLAVTFARTAATSILHREDGIEDDDFLIALAEALVLSGLAMVDRGLVAPLLRRRPRDPPRDRPPLPGHRAPRRARGRRQPVHILAARRRQDGPRHRRLPDAPRPAPHPGGPRARRRAVRPCRLPRPLHAPGSLHDPRAPRPLRRRRWSAASARTQRPTIAELRAVSQPARIFERNSGEHWAGKLYVRRYSIYLTRLLVPTRVTPNAVTWGDDRASARWRRRR